MMGDWPEAKRWSLSVSLALLINTSFLYLFLSAPQAAPLVPSPLLELSYIRLPPKEKKKPKPRPPVVVQKKRMPQEKIEIPRPPAPVPEISTRPSPEPPAEPAPAPQPVQTVQTLSLLDNTDFNPLFNPKPEYPAIAIRAGLEGYVDVDLLIDEEGNVESFSIVRTVGHPRFRIEAEKVLPAWRFPPPRLDGGPAKVKYRYRVNFKLD